MTIPNCMSSFRTTGVFPSAVKVVDTTPSMESLSEKIGLFIPLFTPVRQKPPKKTVAANPPVIAFTDEEIADCTLYQAV